MPQRNEPGERPQSFSPKSFAISASPYAAAVLLFHFIEEELK
jgi:hypothetical protein